jgi:beta-phosphoglucomutase-like phosphatase (HAD superfamily)
MPEAPTRCAVFDLDGTLVDSVGAYHMVAQRAAAPHGIPVTRAQVSRILGSRKAPAALKARHDEWDLTELPLSALPTSFDTRAAFPWASNVTSVVRDQSACG